MNNMKSFRRQRLWLLMVLAGSLVGCSAPASHLLYATIPSLNQIAAFRVKNDSASFTKIVGSPYPTGKSPAAVVVDPAHKFVYVANQAENTISRFAIDSNIGSLAEILPRIDTGFSPGALTMSADGNLLFVMNEVSDNIGVYTANSGLLTQISGSPFSTLPSPAAMALTPSGKFLYVLISDPPSVAGYTVSSSGSLQSIPGSTPTGMGPLALAVDPGEKFLYVANTLDNTLSIFSINATTGALTKITNSPFITGTNPTSLTVSTSGQYLYIANLGSSNITAYSIGSDGQPSLITGSPFATVGTPALIMSDPDGKFLYVVNQSSKILSVLQIDNTDGTLTNSPASASTTEAITSIAVTQ